MITIVTSEVEAMLLFRKHKVALLLSDDQEVWDWIIGGRLLDGPLLRRMLDKGLVEWADMSPDTTDITLRGAA